MTVYRPGFKRMAGVQFPARVLAVPPLVVEESGGVFTFSIDTTGLVETILGGKCWVWQLKLALKDLGGFYAVDAAVPADPENSINILWVNGSRSEPLDILSNHIKSTLSWSNAQITALYELAATKTS